MESENVTFAEYLEARNLRFKADRVKLVCIECGHKFTRAVGSIVIYIECPQCNGVDVEVE